MRLWCRISVPVRVVIEDLQLVGRSRNDSKVGQRTIGACVRIYCCLEQLSWQGGIITPIIQRLKTLRDVNRPGFAFDENHLRLQVRKTPLYSESCIPGFVRQLVATPPVNASGPVHFNDNILLWQLCGRARRSTQRACVLREQPCIQTVGVERVATRLQLGCLLVNQGAQTDRAGTI